ncbi:MAG TPA: tail fiber domain-containing protein [Thermoanaerobaculia bacterium]|nr:tail fiber domain-containing protein [Thermoanaerobaculia bacterium]
MVVRSPIIRLTVVLLIVLMPAALVAGPVAQRSDHGSSVDWQVSATSYDRVLLTISTPGGDVIAREFKAGEPVTFNVKELANIDDGSYTYQLTVVPRIPERVSKLLKVARAASDDAAARAIMRGAGIGEAAIESGSFQISGGSIVSGNLTERSGPGNIAPNAARPTPITPVPNDQVIPDDLIVQGSICAGFDCVNNESFGFDTIRLKENNLRIKFEDTSAGSFPSNDWQLTANDSASGGANKFSIEDITGVKVPFTVTAGAATNSIFVDSIGRLGFRTSTPVLDLHISTSNTPAIRLEQTSAGGFTAQTWDIAGNEANFFVRDVTGGSRLPFRIRPGAPTSSIDIAADGDVGIGTASPESKLHVFGTNTADTFVGIGPNPDGSPGTESGVTFGYAGSSFGRGSGFVNVRPDSGATAPNPSLRLAANNVVRMLFDNEGHIGLGDIASTGSNPDAPFHYTNGAVTARLTTAGAWQDNSSRATKEHITDLSPEQALKALRDLAPVTYNSKVEPNDPRVGFIAEDVPELVAVPQRDGLIALDIVAVVTKVVQEQQKTIEQLNERIVQLEKEKNQ